MGEEARVDVVWPELSMEDVGGSGGVEMNWDGLTAERNGRERGNREEV